MKLIYLDDLLKFPIRIDNYDKENGNRHFVLGIEYVLEYAEHLPTVDAVPVVRCESCERGIVLQHSNNVVCHGRKMPKNGFCSYGIRRNNGICKED